MKKVKMITALSLTLVIAFSCLFPLNASADSGKTVITVDGNSEGREISGNMFGIFLEDINFAIDGGLNPDLVRNNSFEQHLAWDLNWDCRMTGWEVTSGAGGLRGDSPMNSNNPSYFHADEKTVLVNHGYPDEGDKFGFYLEKGKNYEFSFYVRGKGNVKAAFVTEEGKEICSALFETETPDKFSKITARIIPSVTAYADMAVSIDSGIDVDFFRMIPENSFGFGVDMWQYSPLRADLVRALKDLSPSFMRFPGGCLAEGAYDWSMAYNWKTTLGPLEERKQIPNIWGYNQSLSVGFYEYFCLCDYIGATPVPVVHAGLMCQGRGDWKLDTGSAEFKEHIQDILDLIEYANGSADTKWGRVRAENGHKEPFNMKYLAVGNENWMEDYWERFDLIYNAIKEAHPEITVISSAGAWADGKEWEYAWEQIDEKYRDTVVDEHYYVPPWWVYGNYEKYDKYDRDSAKVFVGEYAVHREGGDQVTKSNVYVSIDEAVHCTALIRNSDVVEMACYAPLFARKGYTQWAPNLIWYNSHEVVKTPGYYVQQLYMQNIGNRSLPTAIEGNEDIHVASSVDTENKRIYVYVVNSSKESQQAEIKLDGFRNPDTVCEMKYVGSGLYNISNNFGFLNDFISPRYQKVPVLENKISKSVGPESLNIFCVSYDGENAYLKPGSTSGYRAGTQFEIVFFEYLSKFVVWFSATDFYEKYVKDIFSKIVNN